MKKLFLSVVFILCSTFVFAEKFTKDMLNTFMSKGSMIIYEEGDSITFIKKSEINSIKLQEYGLEVYYGLSGTAFYYRFCDISLDTESSNINIKAKPNNGKK